MSTRSGWRLLALVLLLTAVIYWPGLHGGWLFDDYPNIVDNKGVQPDDGSFTSLLNAALSSPSSDFKRPLASLTFAANFLMSGLDPFWMKASNLLFHLLNGLLVFILLRTLLSLPPSPETEPLTGEAVPDQQTVPLALLITTAWLLLPINLTAVLYVVQRMESLANIFVLVGLIGYLHGRRWMQREPRTHLLTPGLLLCLASITVPTALGALAKETAVMLPLYALMMEWCLFNFRTSSSAMPDASHVARDKRLLVMFLVVLVLPLLAGMAYLLPGLMQPKSWATRDFTMTTRLLSEARVVVDYIRWTIVPTPQGLSFYHDDFVPSAGLFTPWTTAASIAALILLVAAAFWLRPRRPIAALGLAWFLGSHLLTGTILPLELVYEHRNYFASLGLMLAVIPALAPTAPAPEHATPRTGSLVRFGLLGGLLLAWVGETAWTSVAWSNPLLLSQTLASRAPDSPRAQYELGRTYIIYSHYEPTSPFVPLAYEALERAGRLPGSSILPEQALIFMNARMRLPQKDVWWDSLIGKLRRGPPGVQDESSLGALTQCAHDESCDLPSDRMLEAYGAAVSHPNPSARLLSMYADYAWSVLGNRKLGLQMARRAVDAKPSEPAYRATLIRMLAATGNMDEAKTQLTALTALNIGGRLGPLLRSLDAVLQEKPAGSSTTQGDTGAK
ncbi:hypothetical protein [Dyella sp. C9]|uniref:hypothetical protein n=1 Tax=Dyella sp. C9 TaxID=2202154 RepID=UPI000DEF3214|nr:hypothetical protein [Dyella sp. C9]